MPSEKTFITVKNKLIFILISAFIVLIGGLVTAGIVNSGDASAIDLAVKKDLISAATSIESTIALDVSALKPGSAIAIKDMNLRPKTTHSETVMQVAGDSQGYCLTATNKNGTIAKNGYTYFSTTAKVIDANTAKCANGKIVPEILPDAYSKDAKTTLTDPVDLAVEDDMQEIAFAIHEKVKKDPKLADESVTKMGISYILNHPKTKISIGGQGSDFCIEGTNPDGTSEASYKVLSYSSLTDRMSAIPCANTSSMRPVTGQKPQSDIPYTDALTVPMMDSSLSGADGHASMATLAKSGGVMGVLVLVASIVGYLIFRKPRTMVAAVVKKSKSENIRDWDALIAHYEGIIREWASYELDLVKVIDLPLLTDMTNPITAAFYKSLIKARGIVPSGSKLMGKVETLNSPFHTAVQELEFNLEALVNEAKKVRWTRLTPKERSSLQRAQNLLNIAMNQASSDSERQVAYKQLMKEVEGIVVIPKATLLSLEANNQLRLDA